LVENPQIYYSGKLGIYERIISKYVIQLGFEKGQGENGS
jgi:hypothetical protein